MKQTNVEKAANLLSEVIACEPNTPLECLYEEIGGALTFLSEVEAGAALSLAKDNTMSELKITLQELVELTEAREILQEGKQASFNDVQELYSERITNLCDLLGQEELYLGARYKKQKTNFKKQDDFIVKRSEELKLMKKNKMIRYLVFLELAFNKIAHTNDEELAEEVCSSYYLDVDQEAIDLFEKFNNFEG